MKRFLIVAGLVAALAGCGRPEQVARHGPIPAPFAQLNAEHARMQKQSAEAARIYQATIDAGRASATAAHK